MQFWNEQSLSFNFVYSSTCYPAGMGTSKIRLLFATLLQHYMSYKLVHAVVLSNDSLYVFVLVYIS